jgi:hypothetical protein
VGIDYREATRDERQQLVAAIVVGIEPDGWRHPRGSVFGPCWVIGDDGPVREADRHQPKLGSGVRAGRAVGVGIHGEVVPRHAVEPADDTGREPALLHLDGAHGQRHGIDHPQPAPLARASLPQGPCIGEDELHSRVAVDVGDSGVVDEGVELEAIGLLDRGATTGGRTDLQESDDRELRHLQGRDQREPAVPEADQPGPAAEAMRRGEGHDPRPGVLRPDPVRATREQRQAHGGVIRPGRVDDEQARDVVRAGHHRHVHPGMVEDVVRLAGLGGQGGRRPAEEDECDDGGSEADRASRRRGTGHR